MCSNGCLFVLYSGSSHAGSLSSWIGRKQLLMRLRPALSGKPHHTFNSAPVLNSLHVTTVAVLLGRTGEKTFWDKVFEQRMDSAIRQTEANYRAYVSPLLSRAVTAIDVPF